MKDKKPKKPSGKKAAGKVVLSIDIPMEPKIFDVIGAEFKTEVVRPHMPTQLVTGLRSSSEPVPGQTKIWEPLRFKVLPLSEELVCYAFSRPGENLGTEVIENLYRTLRQVSEHGFGISSMQKYWEAMKKRKHLEGLAELFLIVNSEDTIVGFNGYAFYNEGRKFVNLYVDLIATLPKYNSILLKFLTVTILDRAYAPYKTKEWKGIPIYVHARTQNPVVYTGALGMVKDGQLYPSIDGSPVPAQALERAKHVARELGLAKPLGGDLIWHDAYDPPLFHFNQKTPDEEQKKTDEKKDKVVALFKELIQKSEKNGFMLVGLANIPQNEAI